MKISFLGMLLIISNIALAGEMEKYTCWGTEPFWGATLTQGKLQFSSPEVPNKEYAVEYSAPSGTGMDYFMTLQGHGVTGVVVNGATHIVADKNGNIPKEKYKSFCTDGMSDRLAPYSIYLFVEGEKLTGCCSTPSNPAIDAQYPENE